MNLTPRQQRLALDLFTGLVVASVGVALATLSWRLAGFSGSAEPAIVPAAIRPAAAPADIGAAVALAPFGRPSSDGAPPTTLALELRGIIRARPVSRSVALIASPGGKPLPYGVGAAVGGAVIEEIAIDRVILRNGGRAELLAFPQPGRPAAAPGAAVPTPLGSAGPSDAPPPPRAIQPAAPVASGPDLAVQLGATPTGSGYRIGTPPSAAAAGLGLQAGDMIVAVNGTPLGDPTRDAQTVAAARTAGSARVELLRAGQRVTITMPFR
jgi:general secretion pathway protein C